MENQHPRQYHEYMSDYTRRQPCDWCVSRYDVSYHEDINAFLCQLCSARLNDISVRGKFVREINPQIFSPSPDNNPVMPTVRVTHAIAHHNRVIRQRIIDAQRRLRLISDRSTAATISERLLVAERILRAQRLTSPENPMQLMDELLAATTLTSWTEEMLHHLELDDPG